MTDMINIELHPSLQEIADRIRDRIKRTAYEVGQDLIAARALCQHGEWLPFLVASGLEPRNAQLMMEYASKRDDPKYEIISHLPRTRFLIEAREVDKEDDKTARIADLEKVRDALREQSRGMDQRIEELEVEFAFTQNPDDPCWAQMVSTANAQTREWREKHTEEKRVGFGLKKKLKELQKKIQAA